MDVFSSLDMVFGWKFNYWIIIPMNLLVEASAGASKVLDKQETHGKRGVTFRVDSHLFFWGAVGGSTKSSISTLTDRHNLDDLGAPPLQ